MLNDDDLNRLKYAAKEALRFSYSPYSKFKVGAAILTGKGRVYSACNVENSSYSLTICAERNAIFKAVSEGEQSIIGLVIYTETEEPTSPCGACRQVLCEFSKEADIICTCLSEKVLSFTLETLLPYSFDLGGMNG